MQYNIATFIYLNVPKVTTMASKTITVTKEAYTALNSLKAPRESFSETLLRIARRRSLREFAGILSNESADRLENAVRDFRRRHTESHRKRLAKVVDAFKGGA